MSDRELLEMAAKAIGYSDVRVPYGSDKIHAWMPLPRSYNEIVGAYTVDYGHREWDPLNDDGDALRLAVSLRLTVYHDDLAVIIKHKRYSWEWLGEMINEDNGDRDAATRRAIVRAAAEIGRQMQEGGAA